MAWGTQNGQDSALSSNEVRRLQDGTDWFGLIPASRSRLRHLLRVDLLFQISVFAPRPFSGFTDSRTTNS